MLMDILYLLGGLKLNGPLETFLISSSHMVETLGLMDKRVVTELSFIGNQAV